TKLTKLTKLTKDTKPTKKTINAEPAKPAEIPCDDETRETHEFAGRACATRVRLKPDTTSVFQSPVPESPSPQFPRRPSIRRWIVAMAVTRQVTATLVGARLLPPERTVAARRDEPPVEIDQVGVVRRRALRTADAVRVVADRAGRIVEQNVPEVLLEGRNAQDNAPIVALVAESVGVRALGCVLVVHVVARDEQMLEARAVRP